jgi:hypothetical protein
VPLNVIATLDRQGLSAADCPPRVNLVEASLAAKEP